jgi:hypothetical protein
MIVAGIRIKGDKTGAPLIQMARKADEKNTLPINSRHEENTFAVV